MRSTPELAIETDGLVHHFGKTRAVDGIDLAIPPVAVYGLTPGHPALSLACAGGSARRYGG